MALKRNLSSREERRYRPSICQDGLREFPRRNLGGEYHGDLRRDSKEIKKSDPAMDLSTPTQNPNQLKNFGTLL
jgi:hypothetical protein